MPATTTQRTRWRANIGDTGTPPAFDDPAIDDKFAEAAETYPNGSDTLLMAEAVLLGIENLLSDASRRVNYTQNASSESKSDVFRALKDLYAIWERKRERYQRQAGGLVHFGSTKAHPTRIEEYPDA
jgi:hypothetical protein